MEDVDDAPAWWVAVIGGCDDSATAVRVSGAARESIRDRIIVDDRPDEVAMRIDAKITKNRGRVAGVIVGDFTRRDLEVDISTPSPPP